MHRARAHRDAVWRVPNAVLCCYFKNGEPHADERLSVRVVCRMVADARATRSRVHATHTASAARPRRAALVRQGLGAGGAAVPPSAVAFASCRSSAEDVEPCRYSISTPSWRVMARQMCKSESKSIKILQLPPSARCKICHGHCLDRRACRGDTPRGSSCVSSRQCTKAPLGYHTHREAIRTTFMNLFSRSSRATGPFTRVPMGPERSRFMSTAAFSWKMTVLPSAR